MLSIARWPLLSLVALGSLTATALAVAPEVKDEAGFFTPAAVQKANEAIKDIRTRFHKDLLIETFKTVPAAKIDEVKGMNGEAKTKFFHEWANDRAKNASVDGVYVLICKQPSRIQVEVGQKTRQRAFTLADGDKLRTLLVDKFKAQNFDDGLMQAVQQVKQTFQNNIVRTAAGPVAPVAAPRPPEGAKPVPAPEHKPQWADYSWIIWIVLIGLGVWLLFGLMRGMSHAGGGGGGVGAGGYAGGGGGGGGGGFMSGLMGGLFGAVAGNWLYNNFGGGGYHHGGGWGSSANAGEPDRGIDGGNDEGRDFTGTGGDFGDDAGSGGDFGGGGGSDFGSGGDFGGGGGDFGSGGDFGGGGGDFGSGGDF